MTSIPRPPSCPRTRPEVDEDGSAEEEWTAPQPEIELTDDSLVNARHQLAEAIEDLVGVLRSPDVVNSLPETDRANLAKYLMINKLKLENAIAMVRSTD